MRKFYNIVEDNKAPNVQSLWLHNGSLSYFGSNGWETVGDAASLEELGNKVDSLDKEMGKANDSITNITNEITSITSDIDNIHGALENIPSGGSYTEITWQELKNLRDNSQLSAGSLYRITDYQCTTAQRDTRSAGNQFDIIVLALTNNTLSEQAWAALHEGDTYFANSNLSAWKLWYCLDNDTTRFAWADNSSGNGRGIIYRMIDEFNNDVPYDFKNIQFKDPIDSSDTNYYYTFASKRGANNTDLSLSITSRIYNNSMGPFKQEYVQYLNNNLFIGGYIISNIFESNVGYNTFRDNIGHNKFIDATYNTFGKYIIMNTFRTSTSSNKFGNNISRNTFGDGIRNNIFGNSINDNIFGDEMYRNVFSGYMSYNTFENNCTNIVFGSDKDATTKYYYYRENYFESGCHHIVFGSADANNSNFVQHYRIIRGTAGSSSAYLTPLITPNRTYETKIGLNSNGEVKQWCEADLVG